MDIFIFLYFSLLIPLCYLLFKVIIFSTVKIDQTISALYFKSDVEVSTASVSFKEEYAFPNRLCLLYDLKELFAKQN